MLLFVLFIYAFLLAGISYFARQRPEYSHARDTISELAENGSVFEKQVSYGVFLPFGVCAILAALLLGLPAHAVSFLLTAVGLSYALSAFFPCDPKTPAIGSWKNVLHNVIGAGCYGAILYCLNDLADVNGFAKVAFVSLSAFILALLIGWPRAWLGLLQRVAEFSVFLAIIVRLL